MKFIKNLFKKREKEKEQDGPPENEEISSFITFCMMPENDNDIFVKTDWAECTVESAILYAELLYSVNHGLLEEYIFDILLQSAKTDLDKNFVKLIIDSYNILGKDKPLVSASKVLK
jgi:hypothetical protein